jgi:hypothetical protein
MDRLLKKVPTLTKLDLVHGHKGLKWSKRTAKALAAGIAGNTRLRDLALDCSMFDQEQEHQIIIALRSNTALTVLCLPGISEHGATHLAPALEHNQIVSLSFYSEWKTDKDDTFITDGDNLYETGTGAGSIGDAGAEALGRYLARCSSLTELHLQGNVLNFAGARHLSDALKFNTSLKTLVLSSNVSSDLCRSDGWGLNTTLIQLSLDERCVEGIADCLGSNTSLTELRLNGLTILEGARDLLVQALSLNTTVIQLSLGDVRGCSDVELDEIGYWGSKEPHAMGGGENPRTWFALAQVPTRHPKPETLPQTPNPKPQTPNPNS